MWARWDLATQAEEWARVGEARRDLRRGRAASRAVERGGTEEGLGAVERAVRRAEV